MTKPARTAAKVSAKLTNRASLFRLFFLGMFAPRVMNRLQPMPTENSTCVTASANTLTVNLLKSGSR